MKIPESLLESCIDVYAQNVKDADMITEYLLADVPDCGEEVNSIIHSLVKSAVETYILPEAEDYIEDYFEPSAREEAMEDIRRETMERIRNESY